MNKYIEGLKRYGAKNLPNYGSNAHSILETITMSAIHGCRESCL